MTIYEIKRRVTNAPHFFDRDSLQFFGQTLKDFKVQKREDGRFNVSAPIFFEGKRSGETSRIFNPITNTFEREYL